MSYVLYFLVFLLVTAITVVLALAYKTKRSGTNGRRSQLVNLHKTSATCMIWLYVCIGMAGRFVLEPALKLRIDALLMTHLLFIALFGGLTIFLRYVLPGLNNDLAPEQRRQRERLHGLLGWSCGVAGYAISLTGLFLAHRI